MVMQDKRWLGEAVINVLDNAVKYSPCGSKIFIRLQKRNDLVRMEIEDQGKIGRASCRERVSVRV